MSPVAARRVRSPPDSSCTMFALTLVSALRHAAASAVRRRGELSHLERKQRKRFRNEPLGRARLDRGRAAPDAVGRHHRERIAGGVEIAERPRERVAVVEIGAAQRCERHARVRAAAGEVREFVGAHVQAVVPDAELRIIVDRAHWGQARATRVLAQRIQIPAAGDRVARLRHRDAFVEGTDGSRRSR